MMNTITPTLTDQLRLLMGSNGWDYCVHWTLSKDRRSLFWTACSCAGAESSKNGGDKLVFPVSSVAPCRDTMFRHPRTESCALLSQLPVFITLDSGIHAETISSNQSKWLNYTNLLDSKTWEKTVGTQVLIPVAGELVELFATKQVIEDPQVMDFVTSRSWNVAGVKRDKSKNLEAELKRRERLTQQLLRLRSLVPIISEPDREPSVIGDAIEHVKDLQKQVKQLQEELLQLEKVPEVEEEADNAEITGPEPHHHQMKNNTQKQEFGAANECKQTQVEVEEKNELCDKRHGGFVKLMEAFHSPGLHVTRANVVVSHHHGPVSNVFKLQEEEKNETVKAEEVRKSIVEDMRKPCRGRNSSAASSQNGGASIFMLSLCLLLLFLFLSSLIYDYFMSMCPKYVKNGVLDVIFRK